MAFQPTRQCVVAPLFLVSIAFALPATGDTGDAASGVPYARLAMVQGEASDEIGDSNGDGSNIAAVVAAVYERMGQSPEITAMPHDAAIDAMISEQVTGSFAWQPTSERMVRFHFSDPIAVIPLVVFSDAFVAIDPETPADLSGRSMCLPTGVSPPEDIRRLFDQGAVRQQPANDLATCARLVRDGRTDFFVAGNEAGFAAIDSIEMADEFHIATDNPIGLETLHLITPRSNPDGRAMITDFNRALASLAAEGTVEAILADGTLSAVPAR